MLELVKVVVGIAVDVIWWCLGAVGLLVLGLNERLKIGC